MNRKQFLNGSLWTAAAAVLGIPLTEKVIERFPEIQESEYEYTDVFIASPGTVMQFNCYTANVKIGDLVYIYDDGTVGEAKHDIDIMLGNVVSIPSKDKVNVLLQSMYAKMV